MDMEFVQFHPTGMVSPPSVRGIPCVTEACVAKAACCATRTAGASCSTTSGLLQDADGGQRGGGLALHAGRDPGFASTSGAVDARPRRPLHHPRGARGPGHPYHGGVYLDISWIKAKLPMPPSTSRRGCRACTTSSRSWPASTSRRSRSGDRTDHALHHGRHPGRCRHSDVDPARLFAAVNVRRGLHGANRLGGNSLSDLLVFGMRAGDYGEVRARARRGRDRRRRNRCRREGGARFVRAGRARESLQGAVRVSRR